MNTRFRNVLMALVSFVAPRALALAMVGGGPTPANKGIAGNAVNSKHHAMPTAAIG